MANKELPQYSERIPLPPFPNGWYSISYSDELKAGEVKRVRVAGQELVLWRGEDGEAHAFDAYCPHLGANLAVGGRVINNRLVCPFHAWEFGGDGTCQHIPYSNKIPPRAQTPAWSLFEKNGYIAVWHHKERTAPEYEIPEIPEVTDEKFKLYKENTWEVNTHLQEVFENAVDVPHFVVVHGMNVLRSDFKTEGPFGSLELDMERPDDAAQAQVTEDNKSWIRSWVYGPGLSLTRVKGFMSGVSVQTLTPIDVDKIVIRHRYYIGSDATCTEKEANEFLDFYAEDWVRDFRLWNKKQYKKVPNLTDGDGDLNKFRRWYQQFYTDDISDTWAAE